MCQEGVIVANVRNRGTFDIQGGIQSFILEDQILSAVDKKVRPLTLDGRSKFNPEGGISQISFRVKNSGLPQQLESYSTPIVYQACYPYETYASATVCIDPDVRNLNPSKVCRSQSVSVGGTGAPVVVSRVEPVMVPEGSVVVPSFILYVQNQGSGKVVSSELVQGACASGSERLKSIVGVRADPFHGMWRRRIQARNGAV